MNPLDFSQTTRISNSVNAKVTELYPIGDGHYSKVEWLGGTDIKTLVLFRRIKDLRKDAIRTLGLELYKITPKGFWSLNHKHPMKGLFAVSPNRDMTTSTFIDMLMDGHDTKGNGLARVVRKGNKPTIYPTDIDKVVLRRNKQNALVWKIKNPNGPGVLELPYRDFVHVPFATTSDSLLGVAPIQECEAEYKSYLRLMETMEQAQDTSLKIRDVITVPDVYEKEKYEAIIKYILGRNKTLPFIAFKDWKYENKNASISAQDQQYNETLELKTNMLCAAYSVPGWKLNLMNTRKSNGADGDEREWHRDFLEPMCAKIIQALNFSLLDESEWGQYTWGFDFDTYNKADRKTNAQIAGILKQFNIGSTNESRDLIGHPPSEDPQDDVIDRKIGISQGTKPVDGNDKPDDIEEVPSNNETK